MTRAHAQGWETEILCHTEAQAIAQRRRKAGKALDNRSMLQEVRDRDLTIKQLQRQKKKKPNASAIPSLAITNTDIVKPVADSSQLVTSPVVALESVAEAEIETTKPKKPVPYVRVYDYEQLKREAGFL